MGPLSSFSAKIEVAYMFEFIDKATCEDLRIMGTSNNDDFVVGSSAAVA